MQVGFAWLGTWLDTAARQLMGLSSLDIISIGTRRYLIAAGEADGGLSSYEILANGALSASGDVLFSASSGTQNVRYVGAFSFEGAAYVVPAGTYDNNLTVYQLAPNGSFIATQTLSNSATLRMTMNEVVHIGTSSYLFSANNSPGLDRFTITTGGVLSAQTHIADTPATALDSVSAMTSARLQGHDFMFVASAFQNGVSVFEVAAGGGLTPRFHLTPDMVGFNAITALATAQIGPRAFLLAGSSETDTLLVFRVSAGGKLKLMDSLVDKSETRFARISAIEVFEKDGHTYALAAGSDDGLTLFEITYRGRLNLLGVVADQFTTTLTNISDIKVEMVGGKVLVFVASGAEHGFTEFELTLNPGTTFTGGAVNDTIIGSPGDDIIFGMGRNDILKGGAGNDRLIDGRGHDVLTGGTGADIFEFIHDGNLDEIKDFEMGVDRIDLTDYPHLYSYLDLNIQTRAYGAIIFIGTEKLMVATNDGHQIDASEWAQTDFIFG
jgi:Ca2+-binding RTX toxin-like protein